MLSKSIKAAVVAVSVLLTSAVGANAGPFGLAGEVQLAPNIRLPDIKLVSCVVWGGTDFPNDIRIRNTGTVVLPVGTQIHWSLAETSGLHSLSMTLDLGAEVALEDALPRGWRHGTRCAATVL